ncbi:MAG: Mur ligase family protein [Sedimentisphaerales bacterium]
MKTTGKKRQNKSSSKVARVKGKRVFRTYQQAIAYLLQRTDYEKQTRLRYNVSTFNLGRMERLLSLLGNPHQKVHMVHIGGTKGKGSTATMLARMLEANNYTVGLYTSPHVVHLHERIAVNAEMVTEMEMRDLINRVHAPVEKMSKTDPPTFFEIMTALAFMYFVDKAVDIAIIETGLGGRLDSTNVIQPKVVGITSLSIDHQQQLGTTIDQIAEEKAGIFKRGVPTITVQQEPAAMQVLRMQAMSMDAPLSVTGTDIDFSHRFETSREHGPHTRICLTTPTSRFEHLRVPLYGKHQAINCGLALAMLDKLKSFGYVIDNQKQQRQRRQGDARNAPVRGRQSDLHAKQFRQGHVSGRPCRNVHGDLRQDVPDGRQSGTGPATGQECRQQGRPDLHYRQLLPRRAGQDAIPTELRPSVSVEPLTLQIIYLHAPLPCLHIAS